MRLYLAGPMTGHPQLNAAAFRHATAWAVAQGWQPITPHGLDPAHDGDCPDGPPETGRHGTHPRPCWLRTCLTAMLACDAVAFLPGWETSDGARLERDVAQQCGMPVFEVTP